MTGAQPGLDIQPPLLAFDHELGGVHIDLGRLLAGRLIIQGGSGAGKSYCMRFLLEQTNERIPQIVFDWEGEFYTLREVHPYIWVGDTAVGADLQVSAAAARSQCRRLVGSRASVIVDLSDLPNHDARRDVAALWLDELMRVHEQVRHVRMVVIDEIQELCPEGKSVASSDAVKALAARGRKRGLGLVGGTQRLSKLHKDAAEAQNFWIGLTTLDVDVERAARILGFDRAKARSLTELLPGQFLCLGRAMPSRSVILSRSGTTRSRHEDAMLSAAAPPTPAEISAALTALREQGDELDAEAAGRAELLEQIERLTRERDEARAGNTSDPEDIKRAVAAARKPLDAEIERLLLAREASVSYLRLALTAAGELPVHTPATENHEIKNEDGREALHPQGPGADMLEGPAQREPATGYGNANPEGEGDPKGDGRTTRKRGTRNDSGICREGAPDDLVPIELRMLEVLRELGEVRSGALAEPTGQAIDSTTYRAHRKRLIDAGMAKYTRRGFIAPVATSEESPEDEQLWDHVELGAHPTALKVVGFLVERHRVGNPNVRPLDVATHVGLDRWSREFEAFLGAIVNLRFAEVVQEYGVDCLRATEEAIEHEPEARN